MASKAYEKAQAELWHRTQERRAEDEARRLARRRAARASKEAVDESSGVAEQGDGDD